MSIQIPSKEEYNKAIEKVSQYLQTFSGVKPNFTDTSNADNLWSSTMVSHNGISTQVVVCQLKGRPIDVIFSSGCVKLPQENLVAFFRQLLVWNNLATDVAHFALNDDQGVICLVYRRPYQGFDYDEFRHGLETISTVNLNCILLLRKQFGV
jgi:hypothetical protein